MAPDASGDAAVSVLNGHFEIWPDSPLPQLDSLRVSAYAARDRRDPSNKVFAVACDPDLPHRGAILQNLRKLSHSDLLRLRDYGVVSWTREQGCRFVLIYESPAGERLISSLQSQSGPMSEKKVIKEMLAPVTETLSGLAKEGITHRAIRPTNMYLGVEDEDGERVVLGECASVPPAFDQPPAFEPIESLMADPSGRGPGQPADDIYALGVSILALATGKDPAAGRSATQLLAEKMMRGSYHTLVGAHRVPDSLRDVLRGLLEDRTDARWGIEDLQNWLENRETMPARLSDEHKPERGFSFGGLSFHNPRALATAMAGDWDNAALKDGGHEILKWARQSLGDDDIAGRVLTAMELGKRDLSGDDAGVVVARLCMALDNRAPLRYKHVSAHVDGLGAVLAARISDQNFLADLGEIFKHELPGCYVRMVHGTQGNGPGMARLLSRFGYFVKDGGYGGGIERCLYELNPSQYCRSPLIAQTKVMQIGDMLPALEMAAGRSPKGPPIDRHIAAFIAAHVEHNVDSFLKGLNDKDSGDEVAMGMLGLLATVAIQTGAGPFPNLARWIGAHVSPVVESYHHRVWRAKAQAELPGVIESGDIVTIYKFLADGEARQQDRDGYAAAMSRCERIDKEIQFLTANEALDPVKATAYGHSLAVLLSAVIGLGAIATTLMAVVL
jgi:hypothetical protein